MLYELRTYRAMPGRMPDLLARFRDHTCVIWERLGIAQVGFWTVGIGDSNHDLIYLLAWESLAQREVLWQRFTSDPEWHAARSASEANGPLAQTVSNQILMPTDFSPMK
jgi:hypothetical protein